MTQQESSSSLATSIHITPRNQARPQDAPEHDASGQNSATDLQSGDRRKDDTRPSQNVEVDGVPL